MLVLQYVDQSVAEINMIKSATIATSLHYYNERKTKTRLDLS